MLSAILAVAFLATASARAASVRPADRELEDYFRAEVGTISGACLADVRTRADWDAQREQRRRELFGMLGLWPLPPRTDLKAVVTGRIEREAFAVERLHFQSLPGLYVTANLYLPRGASERLPAILYVCGHSEVKTNGVSCGNKTGYQHHGAWFAQQGYVCLVLDTLQLGEIQGDHHGTHRLGQWWWNARGYTPAGVEAWNSIRALDYLETRPEVDRTRLGMTGRSGGGSYTWTTAALDDRIQAAAPVAGITDLENQVVDGSIEGHCDCMFFLNSRRWDFPLNAALIAPRPLLIVNTDADGLFPLNGVQRLHARVKRLYELYNATNALGLVIGPGPHKDTQDLQVPVLRWFNRHLRGADPLITNAATKWFAPADLRVFTTLPADQINTRIQQVFVPQAPASPAPPSELEAILERLSSETFAGWPVHPGPHDAQPVGQVERRDGLELRVFEFNSQPHVRLRLYVAGHSRAPTARIVFRILDEEGWREWSAAWRGVFPQAFTEAGVPVPTPGSAVVPIDPGELARESETGRLAWAWLTPRGIGPHAWSGDAKKQIQLRRRFMLLGQTVDGMRVWDIRRGIRALAGLYPDRRPRLTLSGRGTMGVNALYAALYEPGIERLDLVDLPESHAIGPDYLNVLRVLDIPQARRLAELRLGAPADAP